VRASAEEWTRIGTECVKRRIFQVVDESLVIYHNGTPLLNGAFWGSKGKTVWSEEAQAQVEVVRLIINLTPSNLLQRPITGDVKSLPCPAQ